MDSAAFSELGARLFGGLWPGKEKAKVTGEERRLLDQLHNMPPGVTSNTCKKKIRPSSASANLQTHPCHRTSLYDDRTAVGGGQPTGPSVLQRPKTQAGGPRSQWATRPPQASGFDAELPKHRRQTLGPVDNIANTDYTSRKIGIQPSVGAQLKGKVGHLTIFY